MGSRGDFPHGPAEGLRGIRGYREAPPGLKVRSVRRNRCLPKVHHDDAGNGAGDIGMAPMGPARGGLRNALWYSQYC